MARRYALIIGIQDYKYVSPLTKTREDARSVADFLRATGDFQDVFVVRSDATRSDLVAALKRFQEQARGNDALVYFTGHGFGLVDELTDGVTGYLAAVDTRVVTTGNRVTAQQDGIPLASLGALLEQGNFSSLVMLLDACHSGLLLERGEIEQGLAVFSRKRDYFLITACRGFEQAAAIGDQPHSLFTGAVLHGLARENADDQGQVSADRLFDFVARSLRDSGQEPLRLGMGSGIGLVEYGVAGPVVRAVSEENPYQGLAAFTKETRQFFFGRDREIEMLVQKVQQCGFVPLIGASGSGKSSIVRAGLIPRLEDLGWRILEPMTPGTNPVKTLQELLDRELPPADYYVLPEPVEDAKILLVVDQFEELFALCRNKTEQSQFIQNLLNLWAGHLRLNVVVTMRADFVEACLADEGLTQAIRLNAVWVGPMTGADLEAAIEQPAITQGATIQPKLLAQILQDVATEANCLPLLEFALSQLWMGKAESELTLAAYRKLGGVAGALNAHAEAIYKQLAAQKREHWVQRVMLRLVRTGEGTKDTRQRQRKSDLLDIGKDVGEKDAIESVIQTLVDGRLLVSDRVNEQDVIDLSHEALMQSWKRFAGWRENDREVRRIVDKVEDARREWTDKGKKRRDLLEGRLLKDGKRLLKDAPANVVGTKGFIWKSFWWRRSQFASVMMIPLLVLGVPAEYFWREEAVKRDYDRIERLGNGDPGERAAVLNLAGGCWAGKAHETFPVYFRERVFGNCRSLKNAKLENADLNGANLSGVYLHSANLSGANLQIANLSRAYLDRANLSGARLSSADLDLSRLYKTNLSGSDLSGVGLARTRLHYSNFSRVKLYDTDLRGADLKGSNLSGADFYGARASKANFNGSNLSGARLNGAHLEDARFACFDDRSAENKRVRQCPNMQDIKWDKNTNWQGIQGWETVENIPPALKQQLGLKDTRN
jgi:Caspase domain/Pentapeptide repeats (8 copies)